MADNMLKRVAKAICKTRFIDAGGDEDGWESATPAIRAEYLDEARAAILAMRDPTVTMQQAWEGPEPWDQEALEVWQTLIDAALSE